MKRARARHPLAAIRLDHAASLLDVTNRSADADPSTRRVLA